MSDATSPASSLSDPAPSAKTAISKIAPLSITVDHLRLLDTDGELIRVLLRKYDQFTNEVYPRARQLASATSPTEPVRLVDLKFGVDVDSLE